MNERFTLILHEKGPADKASSPHAIKAWFERGQVRIIFLEQRPKRQKYSAVSSYESNYVPSFHSALEL